MEGKSYAADWSTGENQLDAGYYRAAGGRLPPDGHADAERDACRRNHAGEDDRWHHHADDGRHAAAPGGRASSGAAGGTGAAKGNKLSAGSAHSCREAHSRWGGHGRRQQRRGRRAGGAESPMGNRADAGGAGRCRLDAGSGRAVLHPRRIDPHPRHWGSNGGAPLRAVLPAGGDSAVRRTFDARRICGVPRTGGFIPSGQ